MTTTPEAPTTTGFVNVSYTPTSDGVGVAYIRFREVERIANTIEIAPDVFMDVDADGQPIGIELLQPKMVLGGEPRGVSFCVDTGA